MKAHFVLAGLLLVVVACSDNPTQPSASPPTASFVITPPAGWTDTEFLFDASSSRAPLDPVSALSVRWDWEDDGTWDTDWSTIKTATHVYATAASWTIRLQVRDTDGQIDDATRNLDVTRDERPETVIAASTPDLLFGYRVQVYWSGMDVDGLIVGYWIGWDDPANLQPVTVTDSLFELSGQGTHTFYVAAEDDAGRLDTTPATLQFDVPYSFLTSETALVQALALAYHERDSSIFASLLANEPASNAEFLFLLSAPSTSGETQWDFTEEVRIHQRMFHPESPPPGDPPVPTEIWLQSQSVTLTPTVNFSERTELYSANNGADGKLDPALWRATGARYSHTLFFDLAGEMDYRIEGMTHFVVIENRSKETGDPGKFLLYIWEDLGTSVSVAAVEATTWSDFKRLYR